MDFIADRLEGGLPFRVLTVIDQFTRECLKLEAAAHIRDRAWSNAWKGWPS